MLLAEGNNSACSAWRSLSRSPARTFRVDSPSASRCSSSAASAAVMPHREPLLARIQRMLAQRQVGGHHLRNACDRHRRRASGDAKTADPLHFHRRLPFLRPGKAQAHFQEGARRPAACDGRAEAACPRS